MPFVETNAVKERNKLIDDWLSKKFSKTELSRAYGISRPTVDKWIARFEQYGRQGLEDRSCAPKSCPHKTDSKMEAMIVEARKARPRWGPKKLKAVLEREHPDIEWPASSTIGDILKRNGMVEPRRRKRKSDKFRKPGLVAEHPNHLWCADFKGEFRTGDGRYCYPLTITDAYSRYLLECRGLASTSATPAIKVFEAVFREYGLPESIRTDNGTPFAAAHAIGGLSQMSVWFLKLGIRIERIEPGRPDQNGRHERMHRTLKAETTRPPGHNHSEQQQEFDRFRQDFNHQRPHEALGQTPPAEHFTNSPRSYPDSLEPMEYPGYYEVRRVGQNGTFKWKGQRIFLSETLASENIGLYEVDDGLWSVLFGNVLLGRLDAQTQTLHPLQVRTPALYDTTETRIEV